MKKYMKKLSVFASIVLLVQAMHGIVPNNSTEVLAASTTTQTQVVAPIKILEVEPGRAFNATAASFTGKFGNATVQLTQMSMPEFIGNIELINGNYDMIYIGNNTNSGASPYTAVGAKATVAVTDSGNSTEYYSENDITNKRAGDVAKFISSSQCTVFDRSIFTDTSLKTTKLYANFNTYKDKSNVLLIDNFNTSIDTIVSKYNSIVSSKRPAINLTSTPILYNGNSNSFETNRNLFFKFTVNYSLNSTSNLVSKLYLDINGDGLFKDSELKATANCTDLNNNSLQYRLADNFSGIMPFEIVVTDTSTNVDSIVKGEVAFLSDATNTPTIRVLQLYPGASNNFSLGSDLNTTPLRSNGLYNIIVTKVNIDDFNTAGTTVAGTVTQCDVNNNKTVENKNVFTTLNGNYDMVMMGFADSFGNKDLTNPTRIQDLKNFIASNQSVMFTHDVLTYHIESAVDNVSQNITKNFRDIIGQSRYVDKYNPTEKNVDGSLIPHVSNPGSSTDKTYGYTNSTLDKFGNNTNWIYYTSANKVNSGILTDFPYKLTGTNNNNIIQVSQTHNQWYQLDLEDPNVIPWYTLYAAGDNSTYDARNMYYAYSKGNITYSGTGHSAPNTSSDESKLFINTMLKAARSANHAPTITVNGLSNGMNVSTGLGSLDFNFTVDDLDNDITQAVVKINGTVIRTIDSINPGVNTAVSITKAELVQIVGQANTFTITVDASDHPNTPQSANAQTVSYSLNYVKDIPVVSVTNSNSGYLLGDAINVSPNVVVTSSDTVLQTSIVAPKLVMDQLPLGLTNSGVNSYTLNTFNINRTVVTPAFQSKTFTLTASSSGSYTIQNHVEYSYNNINQSTTPITSTIQVATGRINVNILDKNNSNNLYTNNLTLAIKKNNGTSVNNIINGGNASITSFNGSNLASGSYSFSIPNLPAGYFVSSASLSQYNFDTQSNGTPGTFNLGSDSLALSYTDRNPTLNITIDSYVPVVTITHNPTAGTDMPVTATVNFNNSKIPQTLSKSYTLSNVDGTNPVTTPVPDNIDVVNLTIKSNTKITATATSISGRVGTAQDTINNIDSSLPTAHVVYSKTALTNGNVTATLVFGDSTKAAKNNCKVDNDGSSTRVFTYNGTYVFAFEDALGNKNTVTATVGNIDKTPPNGYFDTPVRDGTTGLYRFTLHVNDTGNTTPDPAGITTSSQDYGSSPNNVKFTNRYPNVALANGSPISGTVADGAVFNETTNTITVEITDEVGNTNTITSDFVPMER